MTIAGCRAEVKKLMDVSIDDVAAIEQTLQQQMDAGVPRKLAQVQAVESAIEALRRERQAVELAVVEQTMPEDFAAPASALDAFDFIAPVVVPGGARYSRREYDAVVAEHKGKPTWMKAPNGLPTKLNERQWVQVRTPSFKAWFGDWEKHATGDSPAGSLWSASDVSRAVDEDTREPKVLFHGTTNGGFMKFHQPGGKLRGDIGIFLTDSYDMARSYVRKNRSVDIVEPEMREMAEAAGVEFFDYQGRVSSKETEDRTLYGYNTPYGDEVDGFETMEAAVADAADEYVDSSDLPQQAGIYALFANIRDPYETDFEGAVWSGSRDHQWVVEYAGEIQSDADGRMYFDKDEALDFAETFRPGDDEGDFDPADLIRGADEHYETTDSAARDGVTNGDGAIIRNVVDDGGGPGGYDMTPATVYVMANPEQVKSADFNAGDFSPRKADIRYSNRQDEVEMSTTVPTAKKGGVPVNDAVNEKWIISTESIKASKTHQKAVTEAIKTYNAVDPIGKRDAMQALKATVIDNLLWLHDQVSPAIRERAKLWYDGAHRISKGLAQRHNLDLRQVAGVMAVLSPQKDWFMNASLGERVILVTQNHASEPWSPAMTAWTESYVAAAKTAKERTDRARWLNRARGLEGQRLVDLGDADAALFVRVFDETYLPRQYRLVTPEGGFGDFVTAGVDEDGNPIKEGSVAWGDLTSIEKAVRVVRDGNPSTMRRTISEALGGEHKVRNFYNNIAAPNSADGHVTIDTHAVAAAMVKALSGASLEVAHNFGTTPKGVPGAGANAATGASGVYGLYADAYREAAAQRGILAREMQSITWEAIRSLYPASFKKSMAPKVEAIFNDYKRGKISRKEARQQAFDLAGGFTGFPWESSPVGRFVQEGGSSLEYNLDASPDQRAARTLAPQDAKDKITVGLSVATDAIPGIKNLYDLAQKGDVYAHALLQDMAKDSLGHLLAGTSAKISAAPVTGLFGGEVEPSLGVTVTFNLDDRPQVLAGLAKFAENFDQKEVHVRQKTTGKPGQVFDDGSYTTPVYTVSLNKALTRKEVQKIIDQSGLYGLTFGDDFIEAYYVGDPTDEQALEQFRQGALRARESVGKNARASDAGFARLWPYGDASRPGVIGYERIRGDISSGPATYSDTARRVAEYLNAKDGKPGKVKTFEQAAEITPEQAALQREIARDYEALPDNDLKNPRVRRAYGELAKEVIRQYNALPVKVEVMTGQGEPYANSDAMRRDILDNNHIFIFGTTPETFGPPGEDFTGHPLLGDTGLKDANGYPLLFNDLLRAVHDYYAHAMAPTQFGPKGEEAAWKNHMSMTPNVWARWALTTETRGQNSWVNFRDDLDQATPIKDRPFARQKAALIPAKYALTGDAKVDAPMKRFIEALPEKQRGGSLKYSARNPQEDTPEFKAWFGDSKVVDADGKPLVVYHGTRGDIQSFDLERAGSKTDSGGWGRGIYFAADPEYAGAYAGRSDGSNIAPVYVSLQNPFVVDARERTASIRAIGLDVPRGSPTPEWSQQFSNELAQRGHDGVLVTLDGDPVEIVAFRPEQIKSAIGNNGDFDPANPDIRRSARNPQEGTPEFKAWFGDSKVVNEDGQPLVMYTGTSKDVDFDAFKIPKNGAWFTADPYTASAYALDNESMDTVTEDYRTFTKVNTASRVVPTYLRIENPYTPTRDEMTALIRSANYKRDQGRLFARVKAEGHDGVDMGNGTWVVIGEPQQIKSAVGNRGGFSPKDKRIQYSNRDPLGYYSALTRGIEGMATKAAAPGAWKAQIQGLLNKGAIKAEELEWTGLGDWLELQQGKVGKDQIMEYLQANGVRVEEVVLGTATYFKDASEAIAYLADRYSMTPDEVREEYGYTDERDYIELARSIVDDRGDQSKYGKYTLPGGENYREVLLTLPVKKEKWVMRQVADGRWEVLLDDGSRSLGLFKTEGSAGSELDYVNRTASESPKGVYKSNHWDQKNVIAHIRVNDRTDADGKRVLFVEELQSDWGQEGKKRGFAGSGAQKLPDGWVVRQNNEGAWLVIDTDGQIQAWGDSEKGAEANALSARAELSSDGIPAAPFVTKTDGWLNLALKRVIAMAVDGGYDAVAFVNGDQSAERYDLSKQVQSLGYDPKTGRLQAFDDRRNTVIDKTGVQPDQLEDYIGKEVAQRLLATEPMMGKHLLDGEQLKVGGEGMKAFYDKIVPNAVKALLKRVGGEPGVVRLPVGSEYQYFSGAKKKMISGREVESQPGFTITDAMREKVSGGQPLFSARVRQENTEAFQEWSDGAPLVTSAAAETHDFKTGQAVVLEAYHGTGRGDRVGEVFQKKRATSGPMAYFTSSPELASSYAQGKVDTSLINENQAYENWFKYQPKGQRSPMDIASAWYSLDAETKARIERRLPDIRTDDDGNPIYEAGGGDIGSYGWNLKRTQRGYDKRGNPLAAAVETWLNSGALFGDEQAFVKVLQLAGFPVRDVTYDSPNDTFPFVYKTYVKMGSPLVTSDVPASTRQALRLAAAKDRSRARYAQGADSWDKNTRTLKQWVDAYLNPANGSDKYVWTSIPDKVTDLLKGLGYDGIIDWSGKGGGTAHPVYIPFEETQVKSAIGNNGRFDATKRNIMRSARDPLVGTPEFKAWFGDSKVVDADGKPLVVYHGTQGDFDVFVDKDERQGFYFAEQPEYANQFAQGVDANVMPVYLSIKNPAEMRDGVSADLFRQIREEGYSRAGDLLSYKPDEYWELFDGDSELREVLQSIGFDGVKLTEPPHNGKRYPSWMAFRPEQIKSAIGNNGQFDPANPDIRYSRRSDLPVDLLDAVVHHPLGAANSHPDYAAAKGGDIDAAARLAGDLVDAELVDRVRAMGGNVIVPVVSVEATGRNKIPVAVAAVIARGVQADLEVEIVQANAPKRTALAGVDRIFNAPEFDGEVRRGARYVLVDDTLTQGATFASLASHIRAGGGEVVGAVALTGKQYSSKISLSNDTLQQLRAKHGDIEQDFRDAVGYGFGALTESEARYIANFKPAESIRDRIVAAGNKARRGQDDASVGGVSYSRRSGNSLWDEPAPSGWDNLVHKFQDKLIDLKRVQQDIAKWTGDIADDLNVYLQEELFHGRAAKRTHDFVQLELNKALGLMGDRGVDRLQLEEYLLARHAKEANAVVAQRNPGNLAMQDGGSGMTNAEADAYFQNLSANDRANLEDVARLIDAIQADTNRMMVDYGLVSQSQVDAWGQMFKHYVPLHREDEGGGTGMGQGYSIKGKEVKSRTGSKRKVVDILANIAMQRERTITRGEKNRVVNALVGLASTNPNPDFWMVGQIPTERVYDEAKGEVVDRPVPNFKQRDNVVTAKVKGPNGEVDEVAVVFNEDNERAMRLSRSMKNLDAAQLEGLIGVSAKISRYFASINTQYNPVFGMVNLVRDLQGSMVNLASTPLANRKGRISKDAVRALLSIYQDERARREGRVANSAWSALWEEFQGVGGQTGFRDLFKTSADRTEAIEKTLDPDAWMKTGLGKFFTANGALAMPVGGIKKGLHWVFDWLSDYNQAMENGVRLATYKAALDQGMSREKAASLAKNITVNFNRKGQSGQQLGAIYAFFNAAMQGTARIGESLFEMEQPGNWKSLRLNKLGKKVVYGGMLLGSMQAMALAAAGFDDEDPPEFARERSLIIPIGDKKYLSIPMPLGLHVIPGLGRHATEFALGGFKDPAGRLVTVMGMFADAFNPIGNAGMSLQTIMPTALDPLAALAENRDFTGRPIAKESYDSTTPGHALSRDTATSISKFLAEAINNLSGGSKYVSGVLSPTPDQIDYLAGQIGGGVWRELSKVDQTVRSAIQGEELPSYKVPLLGRFYGNSRSQAGEGNRYYANQDRINRVEAEIKGLEKDGRKAEAREMRRQPEAYLIAQSNAAERQLRRLRSLKRDLVERGAPRSEVRAVEEKITQVMARLNAAAEKRMAQD